MRNTFLRGSIQFLPVTATLMKFFSCRSNSINTAVFLLLLFSVANFLPQLLFENDTILFWIWNCIIYLTGISCDTTLAHRLSQSKECSASATKLQRWSYIAEMGLGNIWFIIISFQRLINLTLHRHVWYLIGSLEWGKQKLTYRSRRQIGDF